MDKAAHNHNASTPAEGVQLSKWWQSKSCQDAFERAALRRAERLAKLAADNKRRQAEAATAVAELDAAIWSRN